MINKSYKDFIEFFKPFGIKTILDYSNSESGIGLKHDVDTRLDIALEMAEFEKSQGVKSTYFMLHTADYYPDYSVFREIQDLGHEIGFHNDLITKYLKEGIQPKDYLKNELRRLKKEGIEIHGTCSHGSYLARDLKFLNYYIWEQVPFYTSHPSYESIFYLGKSYVIKKLNLYDYFKYDSALLRRDKTSSDTLRQNFDYKNIFKDFKKNQKAIINIHPNQTKPVFLWNG